MNRPLADPAHSTRTQTRIDCLRQLGALAPAAGGAIVAGSLLIAVWLRHAVPIGRLLPWLAAMLLLGSARFVFAWLLQRRFDGSRLAVWDGSYTVLAGLSGFAWGCLAWLPVDDPEHNRLFLIVVILFCILLVSASTLVASSRALAAFGIALALPLLARTFTIGGELAVLFGSGLLVMAGVMLVAERAHRRSLLAAIIGRNEVAMLLRQQRVIFESAGEGIVFLRPQPDYVVSCNRRFAELFGYPLADMAGMPPWRWHPDRDQWKLLVKVSLPTIIAGRAYHGVYRLRRADGSQFWGDVTGMAVAGSDLSAGTVWVVSDITGKRAAEAALRVSEARFRDLLRLSSDLYWEQDAEFRFRLFDGAEALRQRLPLDQLLGRAPWEAAEVFGVHEAQWQRHMATLRAGEAFRDFVYQVRGSDGRCIWLSVSGSPRFDDGGAFVGYHGTASDVTLRIEAEERFRHLAYHDPLTQLPNRRLLADRLEQAIRAAARSNRRVALLLLDLDGFKRINDRYGHAAGDRVLQAVAARLREAVREADTVARMGGDEFVVLLPDVGAADDAIRVAEKIHESICEPIGDGDLLYEVGSSIGISLFPDHGDSADALLHRADHAMYHGKSSGGRVTRLFDTATLS